MLIIRPQDRSDERNEAIVRLYKEGWKQEALAKMWGLHKTQLSYIIGAEQRTKSVHPVNSKEKLTPKHEQVIRRAPEEVKIVPMSRVNKDLQSKSLIAISVWHVPMSRVNLYPVK